MTIQDIKAKFNFPTLMMVRQFDIDGTRSEWLSHWDNERRIRLSMHENVAEAIKNNKLLSNLDYRIHEVEQNGERKPYTRIVVVFESRTWSESNSSDYDYDYSYEKYNQAHGYDDDSIDNAFEGDPDNCWGITD